MLKIQHALLVGVGVVAAACTLSLPADPTPTVPPAATTVFTPVPTVTLTPTESVPATATLRPTVTAQADVTAEVDAVAQSDAAAASPEPVELVRADTLAAAYFGIGDQLYLWEQPSNLSRVSRLINASGDYDLIGRTDDTQWVQVRLADGDEGWFAAGAMADVEAELLEALGISGRSIIVRDALLMPVDGDPRTLFTDAGDETTLERLQSVRVDARTIDNVWLHVIVPGSDGGWLEADGLDVPFDLNAVEIREFEEPAAVRGTVLASAGGLRMRRLPDTESSVLFNLQPRVNLQILGRTADDEWVLVKIPEGYTGWTAASFIDYDVPLSEAPVIENPEPAPFVEFEAPEGAPQVSIVRAPTVNRAPGDAATSGSVSVGAGNRSNVFTTVGDSLTDTPYFLRQIVNGYNLGEYGYLLPTLQYYNRDVGDGNAFSRRAISARSGWSTVSLFESFGDGRCQPGEDALSCEYRITRPSVAVVMMGTNNVPAHPGDFYRAEMDRIVSISLESGVVPILSTIPPRNGFDGRVSEYNQIIGELAVQYNLPVVDLYSALLPLPNRGLSADGIHLSLPPGGAAATMSFTPENLRYGTTMRNLTTLQILHEVRSQLGL